MPPHPHEARVPLTPPRAARGAMRRPFTASRPSSRALRAGAAGVCIAFASTLAACSRPPASHVRTGGPAVEFEHAAASPRMPLRVAPGVVVRRAQFGVLKTDDDGNETFVPTTVLPAEDGTVFGWVVEVDTDRPTLHWQERMRLPKAPQDWGDALDEPDVVISKDGRSVAAQGEDEVQDGELERFYWTLAPGDPAGDYEMDVAIEGRTVAHFSFRVPATVHEKPILVRHATSPRIDGVRPWT